MFIQCNLGAFCDCKILIPDNLSLKILIWKELGFRFCFILFKFHILRTSLLPLKCEGPGKWLGLFLSTSSILPSGAQLMAIYYLVCFELTRRFWDLTSVFAGKLAKK